MARPFLLQLRPTIVLSACGVSIVGLFDVDDKFKNTKRAAAAVLVGSLVLLPPPVALTKTAHACAASSFVFSVAVMSAVIFGLGTK